MKPQLRYVSKEKAHKLIDELPDDGVLILTFNKAIGISDNGKYIKKTKSKKIVNRAESIILSISEISTIDLHNCSSDLWGRNKENIIKTILLGKIDISQLE